MRIVTHTHGGHLLAARHKPVSDCAQLVHVSSSGLVMCVVCRAGKLGCGIECTYIYAAYCDHITVIDLMP